MRKAPMQVLYFIFRVVFNGPNLLRRAVGKKIWPKRKESITVYTARHAMAADCKAANLNSSG